MISKQYRLYLYAVGVIQIIALCLFSIGFFPYKTYLPGFSSPSDTPPFLQPSSDTSNSPLIEPEFDRLVFVVIDALRNDFIYQDTGFKFVNSLIEKGTAIPFTAKATAPTVTMPRIKALTTGTVPSFLDAILNIAESDTSSSLQHHDNWVHQFKASGNRTIHFFGDDTWIRLFPGMFTKTDGTTSFYVSDTVEVDQNVTRHIHPAFRESDWDAIILHYLGLDHIGHLGGPKSPLMHPKQEEMDDAIKSIYEIVADQDTKRLKADTNAKGTLIVLCGDHGMNDVGNHGGSSLGETSSAMVFMSPKYNLRPAVKHETSANNEHEGTPIIDNPTTFTPLRLYSEFVYGYPVIDQVDLVPTLSVLFGFPIPKNNLGKVILDLYGGNNRAPSILRKEEAPTVLRALQLNAYQLDTLLGNQECTDGITRHQNYLRSPSQAHALHAVTAYLQCIDKAKKQLSSTASDYNLIYMSIGCGLMTVCALITCIWTIRDIRKTFDSSWSPVGVLMGFLLVLYAVSMFASSFVEEEHYIWYYYLQSLLLAIGCQSFFINSHSADQQRGSLFSLCILQMVLVRCGMFWRQNDLGTRLLVNNIEAPMIVYHLFTVALFLPALLGLRTIYGMKQVNAIDVSQSAGYIRKLCKLTYVMATVLTTVLILAYKLRADNVTLPSSMLFGEFYQSVLSFELVQRLNQVELGQLIYNYGGACFLLLTANLYVSKHASYMNLGQDKDHGRPYLRLLLYMMTPLFLLLSKPQDGVQFILFTLQFECLLKWQRMHGKVPMWVRGCLTLCMCQFGFFVMGRTNSIASIDLSNAYIGVEGYRTLLIGATTFCSNWSGSLWWCLAGWALALDDDDDNNRMMTIGMEKDSQVGGGAGPTATLDDESNGRDGDNSDRWLSFSLIQAAVFSVALAALSISVTILREHLFIWTVFSPKYLYQMAWIILYFWLAQMLIGEGITGYWYAWSAPHLLDAGQEEEEQHVEPQYEEDLNETQAVST
ncbi:hypothetical protein BCR42DRAFT_497058 [Absidia repens]|uniref:GPI ethanolamine phosphate transferase 2 n=1 Tax=Absidia repens TaxID=90262 RepID=A0A1X2HXH4_9FUNG|nr:hypothetical protein BCR42DRAFT_497058 [Absidia repens]